jgi:hypothetical protein
MARYSSHKKQRRSEGHSLVLRVLFFCICLCVCIYVHVIAFVYVIVRALEFVLVNTKDTMLKTR